MINFQPDSLKHNPSFEGVLLFLVLFNVAVVVVVVAVFVVCSRSANSFEKKIT